MLLMGVVDDEVGVDVVRMRMGMGRVHLVKVVVVMVRVLKERCFGHAG